jgi:hypothetical protein
LMNLTALFLSILAFNGDDVSLPAPPTSADDVISRLIRQDENRQAMLNGYTSFRRYVIENRVHQKRAEMLVRVTCRKDGSKNFEQISSSGWSSARKHVFPRLLEGEAEASHPLHRDQSRIGPENYSFELAGTEPINGRVAFIIDITPKEAKKYLVKGRMWVDTGDFAVIQIEGKPAKSPSFWIKSTHFVHRYEKRGPFWFPVSDHSTSDARFFGATDVTIEYFDYAPGFAGSLQ